MYHELEGGHNLIEKIYLDTLEIDNHPNGDMENVVNIAIGCDGLEDSQMFFFPTI
jgi:hypothetical protein